MPRRSKNSKTPKRKQYVRPCRPVTRSQTAFQRIPDKNSSLYVIQMQDSYNKPGYPSLPSMLLGQYGSQPNMILTRSVTHNLPITKGFNEKLEMYKTSSPSRKHTKSNSKTSVNSSTISLVDSKTKTLSSNQLKHSKDNNSSRFQMTKRYVHAQQEYRPMYEVIQPNIENPTGGKDLQKSLYRPQQYASSNEFIVSIPEPTITKPVDSRCAKPNKNSPKNTIGSLKQNKNDTEENIQSLRTNKNMTKESVESVKQDKNQTDENKNPVANKETAEESKHEQSQNKHSKIETQPVMTDNGWYWPTNIVNYFSKW